jgi:hypothetical protein
MIPNNVTYKVGITGNHYVYSKEKEPVVEVSLLINKSINSVYFNKKYELWVIRIKNKKQKEILQKLFNI